MLKYRALRFYTNRSRLRSMCIYLLHQMFCSMCGLVKENLLRNRWRRQFPSNACLNGRMQLPNDQPTHIGHALVLLGHHQPLFYQGSLSLPLQSAREGNSDPQDLTLALHLPKSPRLHLPARILQVFYRSIRVTRHTNARQPRGFRKKKNPPDTLIWMHLRTALLTTLNYIHTSSTEIEQSSSNSLKLP